MKVIHDNERETSPSVLFQALTFFVWIGALALLAASVKQAQKGHPDPRRFVMAVIHPIPWCVAVVERRRVRKFLSNTVMLQEPVHNSRNSHTHCVVRILNIGSG